jgi:hypothetical protein
MWRARGSAFGCGSVDLPEVLLTTNYSKIFQCNENRRELGSGFKPGSGSLRSLAIIFNFFQKRAFNNSRHNFTVKPYKYLTDRQFPKYTNIFGSNKTLQQKYNRRYRYFTQLVSGSGRTSGSIHQLKLALMYGSVYKSGFEHFIEFTYGNGSGPKDGSVPCYKPLIKKTNFLEGKISLETKNNPTLMHRMGDEYDSLLRSLGVDDTMVHNDTDATADPAGDESLLDVDDEDEVRVLDPPLLPTPATASLKLKR